MGNKAVSDSAVNKVAGLDSRLPHGDCERPSHCQFRLKGSLTLSTGMSEIVAKGVRSACRSAPLRIAASAAL